MSKKKSIPFLVLDILSRFSTAEAPLTASDIVRLLKGERGQAYDPRTVRAALESLVELGYPVRFEASGCRKSNWYIERALSGEQTDALLLGLCTSPYIGSREIADLRKALSGVTSPSTQILDIRRNNVTKFDIYELIKSINVIYKAIQDKYMLNFSLINYVANGKKVFDTCEGRVRRYLVKPIAVTYAFGSLSLFGELGDTNTYRFFRIEKLNDVRLAAIPFTPIEGLSVPIPSCRPEGESIAFSQGERAVLRISESLVGEFMDKFGGECHVICSYGGLTEFEVTCDLRLLKRLILSFGGSIEALSPTKLRRAVATVLQAASAKYPEMRKYKGNL